MLSLLTSISSASLAGRPSPESEFERDFMDKPGMDSYSTLVSSLMLSLIAASYKHWLFVAIILAEIGRSLDLLEYPLFSFSLLITGREMPESVEILRCILKPNLRPTLGSFEVILGRMI